MATPDSLRRTFGVFCVFVVGLVLGGCTCDKPHAAPPSIATICVAQGETLSTAAPMTNSTLVPGTLHASFSVDESGQPTVHVPIDVAVGIPFDKANARALGAGALHRSAWVCPSVKV